MATLGTLSPNPHARPQRRTALHAVPDPPGAHVVGQAAESIISEKHIGDRIKHLRLKKSMGLVELGRHTGLSASFLSQLETGRVVPTLRNLARIATVFSKDLSYFFEPEPQSLFRMHRGKERVRLPQSGVDDPSYFFESLGYLVPDRQLDPYFGCEFLYLLSGSLIIRHGAAIHRVDPGDAIYFDAATSHSYQSAGDAPATALIVTLQQPVHAGGNGLRGSQPPGQASKTPRPLSMQPNAAGVIPRAG